MGMFRLWATWENEYMDIFVNIDGRLKVCGFDKTWSACQ